MARVWQGRIIAGNSLPAQIAASRAAFGVDRTLIRTVSGRGYQFTGEIRNLSEGPNNAGAEVEKAEHTLLRALVRDAVEFAVSDSRPGPAIR